MTMPVALNRAVLGEALLLTRFPRATDARRFAIFAAIIFPALGLLAAALVMHTLSMPLAAVCLAGYVSSVQDSLRYQSFHRGAALLALTSDTIWAVTLAACWLTS